MNSCQQVKMYGQSLLLFRPNLREHVGRVAANLAGEILASIGPHIDPDKTYTIKVSINDTDTTNEES